MVQIKQLITRRFFPQRFYLQLVYEWEEVFAKTLHLKYRSDVFFNERKKIWGSLTPFITKIQLGKEWSLKFDIFTNTSIRCNWPNIIPWIIDFYVRERQLPDFYERYNNHKLVLVSSKEAYTNLISHNCPFRIEHLALSLPDKYKIEPNTCFDKQYDLMLLGRTNKVLLQFLETYKEKHSDFNYIYPKYERRHFWKFSQWYYYSTTGEYIGALEKREKYIECLKKTKVALYSTPGIDTDRPWTSGFNQVTPRFLEYLACGCNVLCRYEPNPDTEYYELEKYWPTINTYEEFEKAMDVARTKQPDMKFYSDYLAKHYTSERVKQLLDILLTIK